MSAHLELSEGYRTDAANVPGMAVNYGDPHNAQFVYVKKLKLTLLQWTMKRTSWIQN